MKNYSLVIKLVVCCALVACCTFGLSQSPLYAQGRTLSAKQLDAIVTPNISQCSSSSGSRVDAASVIPTNNAKEFPRARILRTLHGMWRGQVYGDYNKDLRVDYFWIIDTQRNEGLLIAQRTGNDSMAGLQPVPNAPKISYLMCANEGYIPSSEGGSQLHEFVKVSDSIDDAPRILGKATGLTLKAGKAQPNLSDLWQQIVASGYFKSLPAVAFAGALYKPMEIEPVASPIGPAQLSLKLYGEYYGGGATQLKFTPGVPMRGVEYVQFVGTTATAGDFFVASPGNGKSYKVESFYEENYDIGFDNVTFGPLQDVGENAHPKRPVKGKLSHSSRQKKRK